MEVKDEEGDAQTAKDARARRPSFIETPQFGKFVQKIQAEYETVK